MLISKEMYDFALKRIEELLPITKDSMEDPNMPELLIVSGVVEDYEKEHYPLNIPDEVKEWCKRRKELGLPLES